MSKGKQRFKETDAARLMRAAQKSGVRKFTVRVTPAGALEIETQSEQPSTKVIDADEPVEL